MEILDCTISICNVFNRLNPKNNQKEASMTILKICPRVCSFTFFIVYYCIFNFFSHSLSHLVFFLSLSPPLSLFLSLSIYLSIHLCIYLSTGWLKKVQTFWSWIYFKEGYDKLVVLLVCYTVLSYISAEPNFGFLQWL